MIADDAVQAQYRLLLLVVFISEDGFQDVVGPKLDAAGVSRPLFSKYKHGVRARVQMII